MEFTGTFPVFGGLVRSDANGKKIASLVQCDGGFNIIVHSGANCEILKRLIVPASRSETQSNTKNNIQRTGNTLSTSLLPVRSAKIEMLWAPNDQRIALVNYSNSKIYIYDTEMIGDGNHSYNNNNNNNQNGTLHNDSMPIAIIGENNLLGFERVLWVKDSLHLIVVLRHRVGIRIWRIDERFPRAFVNSPKYTDKGLSISPCGRWMALLRKSKDYDDLISVYDLFFPNGQYKEIISFSPPENAYLEDISFAPLKESPTDQRPTILAWEAPSDSSRLFVFSADGDSCKVISQSPKSDSLTNFGYTKLVWGPMGWIAVAIKDSSTLVIWNFIINRLGAQLSIGPAFIEPEETIIFKERVTKELLSNGTMVERSRYESGFILNISRNNEKKLGNVSSLNVYFSSDSAYLAVVSPEYSNCVWILNLRDLSIVVVLVHLQPVRCVTWHTISPILTITTDSSNIYIWQPNGCLCVEQPAISTVKSIKWSRNNDILLLAGEKSFCLAVPDWATY